MLMTPITPKVMARPIAASSSTEPSERPYQRFCTWAHIASVCSIERIARSAAFLTSGDTPPIEPRNAVNACWSPCRRNRSMAARRSASDAWGAARHDRGARQLHDVADGGVLLSRKRRLQGGQGAGITRLQDGAGGGAALAGVGRQQLQAAEGCLHGGAHPVVEAHDGQFAGRRRGRLAGCCVEQLAGGITPIDRLVGGDEAQAPVGQRVEQHDGMGRARGGDLVDGGGGVGEVVGSETLEGGVEPRRLGGGQVRGRLRRWRAGSASRALRSTCTMQR